MEEVIVHEYVFTRDFDDNVYNNGPVQNDLELLNWVKNCVASIKACAVTDSVRINHKGNVYVIKVNDKGPLVPLPEVDMSTLPPHLKMQQDNQTDNQTDN